MVANITAAKPITLRSLAVVVMGTWSLTLALAIPEPAWAAPPADVPNVVASQIDAALSEFQLNAPGVKVVVDDIPTDVDHSLVVVIDEIGLASNPDGGATTAVRLVPGAVVPNLFELAASDAENQLSTRGLVPSILTGNPNATGVTVTDQNVAAESLVPFNTVVGYSLSAAVATSAPPVVTPSPTVPAGTNDSSVPWLIVGGIAALVVLLGAITTARLMRRPRKPPSTPESLEIRARATAPPTTHMEPLDRTPTLSLWLDPHSDPGDQVLEEVRS